eukprot:TRINITY_DN111886_c0_g1_i1.p1 TRINITY_DN111886_c0_g1~~TRINITY_DN111886_c0_g1_i1.p1  ORF type:complete len:545 (-),score=196.14 TRINITY_DN111886_c0_g1_i1:123-1757(-)
MAAEQQRAVRFCGAMTGVAALATVAAGSSSQAAQAFVQQPGATWAPAAAAEALAATERSVLAASHLRGAAASAQEGSSFFGSQALASGALLGAVSAAVARRRCRQASETSRSGHVVACEAAGSEVPEFLEAPEPEDGDEDVIVTVDADPEDVTADHASDLAEEWELPVFNRRQAAQSAGLAAFGAAVGISNGGSPTPAAEAREKEVATMQWVQYDLNTRETLYDIDFDPKDEQHGFVVGAKGLFYESKDGGKRWVSRSFKNLSREGISYRFQTVAVYGNDVWVVGKPPLLLHSKDGGKSWKKVPLSAKLPGVPKVITALGDSTAEMTTSSGAIYYTENDGKNWTSKVRETVDATLNRVSASGVEGASYFTGTVKSIKRDPNGNYLAVAQRGNFYLTYQQGNVRWVPHNRISARRIQAMGFRVKANGDPQEGVWMSLNGGLLHNCTSEGFADMGVEPKDLFDQAKIKSGGIGIIDLQYRTANEGWAVGGSGIIYQTKDGGKTWGFDKSADDLPCNLYDVKFFNKGKVGFLIGSNGILLRQEFNDV